MAEIVELFPASTEFLFKKEFEVTLRLERYCED